MVTARAVLAGLHAPYTPRDYQVDGIEYLWNGQRRFLTDEPRLGKTLMAAFAAEPPVLIVAPTYLVWHWYDSLVSYGINKSDIAIAVGSRQERQNELNRRVKWTIANIEMLRKKADPADRYNFQVPKTFIVDEAHHLRGRKSEQSAGAFDIAVAWGGNGWRAAERVYLLTGTPVKNRPDDLYATLRLLDPKRFTSYWKFVGQYCKTLDVGFGPRVVNVKDPTFYKPLHDVMAQYSLGRTAEQVGLQLSDLTIQVIRVQAPDEFKTLYKRLKKEYRDPSTGGILDNLSAVYIKMRKITRTVKLQALLELLTDTGRSSRNAVVFTIYRDTAEQLAKMCNATCITGEVPPDQRRAMVAGDDLIVATQAAASEGLDLAHIDTAIFFEHDHVPGLLEQARSRNKLCPRARHEYHLLVRGTIDEVVYKSCTERALSIQEIMKQSTEEEAYV